MPFETIAAATIPTLVGGIFDGLSGKKAKKDATFQYKKARKHFKIDRRNDREYVARVTKDARRYAESQTAADRRYAEAMLKKQQTRQDQLTKEERDYLARLTKEDRAYLQRRLEEDRAYAERIDAEGYDRYWDDQNRVQENANTLAERNAASRGVDFAKLRDDAIAAGFNPLTAMSMAHAYSTEVNYANNLSAYGGGVQLPTGGYTSGSLAAGSPGEGGGGVQMPMSQPVAAGLAPGGIFQGGGGYSTGGGPALASGSFIADALQRGIDTWYNHQANERAEEQDVMAQVQRQLLRKQIASETPRNFGYDLTKIAPYSPSVTVGNGAFSALHDRPIVEDPVRNLPATAQVDIGGGHTATVLSPDREWSEPFQIMDDVALTGQAGWKYYGRDYVDRVVDGFWKDLDGIGSMIQTGSRPVGAEFMLPRDSNHRYPW